VWDPGVPDLPHGGELELPNGSTTGNDEGRGLTGAIVVLGAACGGRPARGEPLDRRAALRRGSPKCAWYLDPHA
jgi:hypothetical protein